MKTHNSLLTLLAAPLMLLNFTGCAHRTTHCEWTTVYATLSPAHPNEQGFQLVRLTKSGRVTIRHYDGRATAVRQGDSLGDWRVESVNPESGVVRLSFDQHAQVLD